MAIQAQIYPGFCLGGTQDLLMENGCGGLNSLCFNINPQQEQQHFVQRNNMDYNQQTGPFLSHNISAHFENHRMEIDMFINSQNERLRMALQEQRKHQITQFLKKHEPKIQFLINQKEEEISKANKRTLELQSFLQRIENDNRTWQRVARENEAIVASLNSTIERLRETAAANAAADDAQSCCDCDGDEEEGDHRKLNENLMNFEQVRNSSRMVCRRCSCENACVVMLPCRHLCACRDCERFLDSCPVCNVVKKASIEALV